MWKEKKGFFTLMTKCVCLVIFPENLDWVNGLQLKDVLMIIKRIAPQPN